MEEGTHGWIEGSGEKGEEKKKPFRRDLGDMKWVKTKNITFAYNINETIVNQCLS